MEWISRSYDPRADRALQPGAKIEMVPVSRADRFPVFQRIIEARLARR